MKIQATIFMVPVGKARPRSRRLDDGRTITYTPAPTLTAQGIIQIEIRKAIMELGKFPDGAAIRMTAVFYRLRPLHLPRRIEKPITKPDWDNLGKTVSDSLEQFAYRNDSQLTTVLIKKRFGDPPRIEILLEDDDDE